MQVIARCEGEFGLDLVIHHLVILIDGIGFKFVLMG